MSAEPSTQGTGRNIRIGKYEVVAHIASGGMGAVYRALDTENSREVALKVMTPEMAAKPAMLERFRREARSGLKLRHENIVALYEFGEANGTCFLAMEFVEGVDLHEYIDQKGTLDPEESRQIVIQAARALSHAHKHGIVHRDIKPSNFLLTQRDGQVRVKLTDLGLAREAANEEFRVTRSGTTVGTVDYISPEQARDSGMADIRSDLYSLGCTWYHMLAGQTPFADGGLAERLLKHMTAEVPDIRRFNQRVSDELVRVLLKLLAKKPEDRYQSPQELIQDLVSINPTARPAKKAATPEQLPSPKSKEARRGTTGERRAAIKKTRARRSASRRWAIIGGSVAALVLVGGGVAFFTLRDRRPANQEHVTNELKNDDGGKPVVPAIVPTPVVTRDPVNPRPPDPVTPAIGKPKFAPLYKPSVPLDVAQLRREFERPWTEKPAVPPDGPTLQVARTPADGVKRFTSLPAAFTATPTGKTTVIEISDNGPLFELPALAADRSLVVRAAKGFRPLLVWDLQRTLDERKRAGVKSEDGRSLAFLAVERGNLTLENIDLVVQWPDRIQGRGTLCQVTDGSLAATGCTFSSAGRSRDGVAVARLTGVKEERGRCRLDHCYGRGSALSVLDLDLPGSESLIDHCLFVGGEPSAIDVRASNLKPIGVSVVRSTIVCGESLLTVHTASAADRSPACRWASWDSLFSRSTRRPGGDMVVVVDKAGLHNMRWKAINCLYAGWQTLLTAEQVIRSGQFSDWRVRWSLPEGDAARSEPWPLATLADPAEVAPAFFRTADTAVAFAATAAPDQPLGCMLNQLPPIRDSWLGLTFERFPTPPLETLAEVGPPEIPAASGDLYQGEVIDLNKVEDLGEYLQQVQKSHRFGSRVVLHLSGSGVKKTTPLLVPRGTTLVLYVSAPTGESSVLSLRPSNTSSAGPQALIETEDGGLDIIGADLRLGDEAGGRALTHLVKVNGGDLRLLRCRLQTPTSGLSATFQSLIYLRGSGAVATDKCRGLAVERCILVSGHDLLKIEGIGARVVANQSLFVASGNGLALDLGKAYQGRANVQWSLTQTTIAARRAIVTIADVADANVPIEPAVIQTSHCAFMSPFPGASNKCGMLTYEATALAHGLLLWQSESDGYDRQLFFQAAPATALPDKPQGHAAWTALWGSSGDRLPLADLNVQKRFEGKNWDGQLDRLAFQMPRNRTAPGANLEKLGLKK